MTLSEIIALYLLIFFVGVAAGAVVIIAVEYEWSVKSLLNKLKPKRKTPLQKEIEAEQKEIAKLKQHKRDMEELEELKKQKDRLWEEAHEEEYSTFKGIDPLPHLENLQRNEFSADDIRYKAMKKQSEHFEEIIREADEYEKSKYRNHVNDHKAEAFDSILKSYDEASSEGHMADEVCNIIQKYESGESK